jgi:hypothetical protein
MRPLFRRVAPDRLKIREGGGIMTIFGLPFFAAGVFVLLASVGLVTVQGGEDLITRIMLPIMGVAFTIVGGVLAFGRAWTTVDGTRREVSTQWGLLVPMRSESECVDNLASVALEFQKGDSDSADTFRVSLKAPTGRHVRLCSSTRFADARSCAIAVGEMLRVDFEDASTDHPVRLIAGEVEMPLQQHLQMEGRPSGSPERPANARSDVQRERNALRITIPTPRSHPIAYVLTLIPVALAAAFATSMHDFFRQTHTPAPVGWAFLGFFLLFFGVLPAVTALNGYLRTRHGGTIVTVSPSGIGIQERGAWRTGRLNSIPAADILDIDFSTRESAGHVARLAAEQRARDLSEARSTPIGPRTERMLKSLSRFAQADGITVKTRQGFTTFGKGLDDEEILYLHALVRHALIALS